MKRIFKLTFLLTVTLSASGIAMENQASENFENAYHFEAKVRQILMESKLLK